jgi:hypothetical protein
LPAAPTLVLSFIVQMFLKKDEGKVSPEKLTRKYFWGRCDLKIFSKTGKALEYFGFDVSAAVSQVSPEKQTLHFFACGANFSFKLHRSDVSEKGRG